MKGIISTFVILLATITIVGSNPVYASAAPSSEFKLDSASILADEIFSVSIWMDENEMLKCFCVLENTTLDTDVWMGYQTPDGNRTPTSMGPLISGGFFFVTTEAGYYSAIWENRGVLPINFTYAVLNDGVYVTSEDSEPIGLYFVIAGLVITLAVVSTILSLIILEIRQKPVKEESTQFERMN